MKKPATKAERDYKSKVAAIPCVACGNSPVHVHHIRHTMGVSQRASDYLTCALCPECHQGALSIHATPKQFQAIYGSEMELLAKTIERVNQ